MKTTKIILPLGFSLIILGASLGYFTKKDEKPVEIIPISQERNCAIEVLYFEARNTSKKEQQAILDVVLNRVRHQNYPDTICEVVQQPFQFSFRNNSKANTSLLPKFETLNAIDKRAYLQIEKIVDDRLFSGEIKNNKILPKNALHYHTKEIYPRWGTSKRKRKIVVDKEFRHRYYAFVG